MDSHLLGETVERLSKRRLFVRSSQHSVQGPRYREPSSQNCHGPRDTQGGKECSPEDSLNDSMPTFNVLIQKQSARDQANSEEGPYEDRGKEHGVENRGASLRVTFGIAIEKEAYDVDGKYKPHYSENG